MYDATITAYDVPGYKFTGKERDAETGNDHFGARCYSNGLGRFATPDPLMGSARGPIRKPGTATLTSATIRCVLSTQQDLKR